MSLRVCAVSGCPELIPAGRTRCATHERAKDKARGTRQERGYDRDYDKAKTDLAYVTATSCATCAEPFTVDNPRTAGHVADIRTHGPNNQGIIPQCRRCNYGWRKGQ